jgi:hypothetical protein
MGNTYTKKGPGRWPVHRKQPPFKHDFAIRWFEGRIVSRGKCRKCGAKFEPRHRRTGCWT